MKHLNKFKTISFVIAAAFLLAACANQVFIERDKGANLNNYSTYQWISLASVKGDSNSIVKQPVSDLADRQLKQSVDAYMEEAGFRKDARRPQILITYDLLQEKGLHQNSGTGYYGSPFARWYFNPYAHGWYPLYYPSQFGGYSYGQYQDDDKTLTLSFIDANTNKTVVQVWTTEHTNSRKLRSKEIDRAVSDIFRKLNLNKN